jgi:two-component system NarL family sensor kinase
LTSGEAERALLAERVLAEQEERRRLAELLHDGPVQHLSAISQLLDAALATARDGDAERASELVARGLELARTTSQELRALCDDLEPRTLRELGFAAAVEGLGRRLVSARGVELELDVEQAGELGDNAQVALYQIVREALEQAIRRGPPDRIEISLSATASGGAELVVSDDGPPERRSAVLELLAERAATLNAGFGSEPRMPRGLTIRVELPPSAARR